MAGGWHAITEKLKQGGFKLNDLFPMISASYVTRRWPNEPLWLMTVGPPGSGKSATMGLFTALPDVKLVSAVTPAALISGWGSEHIDPSLLAELHGKTLMAKDFGTILHMGWATASQVFSLLREAFDGHVSKNFGMFRREYSPIKFNFVAAATDIYEQFRTFQQHLGERFLRFGIAPQDLPSPPPDINDALKAHVAEWLTEAERAATPVMTAAERKWIRQLAALVAKLRTEVVHDGHSHEILEVPGFEGGARLEKQLTKLYLGLRLVEAPPRMTDELVKHTCRSCIPPRKVAFFRHLLAPDTPRGTIEIAETLKLGYGVVRKMTNDLYAFGLLDRKMQEFPKAYQWEVRKEFCNELSILLP